MIIIIIIIIIMIKQFSLLWSQDWKKHLAGGKICSSCSVTVFITFTYKCLRSSVDYLS